MLCMPQACHTFNGTQCQPSLLSSQIKSTSRIAGPCFAVLMHLETLLSNRGHLLTFLLVQHCKAEQLRPLLRSNNEMQLIICLTSQLSPWSIRNVVEVAEYSSSNDSKTYVLHKIFLLKRYCLNCLRNNEIAMATSAPQCKYSYKEARTHANYAFIPSVVTYSRGHCGIVSKSCSRTINGILQGSPQ